MKSNQMGENPIGTKEGKRRKFDKGNRIKRTINADKQQCIFMCVFFQRSRERERDASTIATANKKQCQRYETRPKRERKDDKENGVLTS